MRDLTIVTIGAAIAMLGLIGVTSVVQTPLPMDIEWTTAQELDAIMLVVSATVLIVGIAVIHIPVWRR